MESRRVCKRCKKQKVVHDELGNSVCEACGTVQDFDNFQAHFGGIDGFHGTVVRIGSSGDPFGGDFNYKENKIYHAKTNIEDITMKLGLSSLRSSDVIRMIEQVTEGEFGQGNWFPILIGACSCVVMRKENQTLSMAEVSSVIDCELHELGRMVIRVVDFLNLDLPEFDIVSSFERSIRNSPSLDGVSDEKMEKMIKQGRFLLQCLVKWFLTTGRQPSPVVVAVLVFVAELNQLEVTIEEVAKEIHAGVATSRLRYKEIQKTLVQVAQALPWGNNVTVKNITKNAPLVIQYMEMKSRLKKSGVKRKKLDDDDDDGGGFDLEEMLSGCLRKDVEYGLDDCYIENDDAPYFEVENRNGNRQTSFDELNALKISQECLSRIYTEFSNYRDSDKSFDTIGETRGRKKKKKKKKGLGLWESKEWWTGKSDLCRKLSLEQILTKNVGFSCLPPSFVSGNLACERRREKINAAKLRINQIMQPTDTKKDDLQVGKAGNVDWEDCIIELLLLHQVKEEEIEQGHYNRLVDLHVFNPVSPSEMFAQTQRRRGSTLL